DRPDLAITGALALEGDAIVERPRGITVEAVRERELANACPVRVHDVDVRILVTALAATVALERDRLAVGRPGRIRVRCLVAREPRRGPARGAHDHDLVVPPGKLRVVHDLVRASGGGTRHADRDERSPDHCQPEADDAA